MINDNLIIKNIVNITHESYVIRKKSLDVESLLQQIYGYIELQCEKELVFRRKDMLYKMMNSLQTLDDEVQNMPNNGDFKENPYPLVKNDIELMELIIQLHKNALKRNDACKRYFEMVCGVCYWLLKECKSQKIAIPGGYKLSKLIQNEGFVIKYPKPTDLLLGKDPTGDVTL